ncbi:MAG: hypothetical protein PVF58_15195 [Candidatus Methanofastidiosia archaeon]|jgi:hypothetical protein
MAKQNMKNSDKVDFLFKVFIIAFGLFITTLLILLTWMVEWGYDIFYLLLNYFLLYLPVLYICWIFKSAYDNKHLFSESRIRDNMWITIIVIVFLSIAQFGELYSVFHPDVISSEGFFLAYANNAIIHPLALICLILCFNYFQKKFSGKRLYPLYAINIIFIGFLVYALLINFSSKLLHLLRILGIYCEEEGVNYVVTFIALVVLSLLLFRQIREKFPYLFDRFKKQ